MKSLFAGDAVAPTVTEEVEVKPAPPSAQEAAAAAEKLFQDRQVALEAAKKALRQIEVPGADVSVFSLQAILARQEVSDAEKALLEAERAREIAVSAWHEEVLRSRHAGLARIVERLSAELELARKITKEIVVYGEETSALVGPRATPWAVFAPIVPNTSESADLDLWRAAMRREKLLD